MNQALSYPRLVLCIKPHEKRPLRREITIFPKVSKMAIFAQKGKGVTKVKFSKMVKFLVNFKEAKKIGIQVL